MVWVGGIWYGWGGIYPTYYILHSTCVPYLQTENYSCRNLFQTTRDYLCKEQFYNTVSIWLVQHRQMWDGQLVGGYPRAQWEKVLWESDLVKLGLLDPLLF